MLERVPHCYRDITSTIYNGIAVYFTVTLYTCTLCIQSYMYIVHVRHFILLMHKHDGVAVTVLHAHS